MRFLREMQVTLREKEESRSLAFVIQDALLKNKGIALDEARLK